MAVLGGKDRTLTLQFVFRVYDFSGSSIIERSKVEKLLQMAYGDRLKERSDGDVSRAQRQLDSIFSLKRDANSPTRLPPLSPQRDKAESASSSTIPTTLHLRDFEQYQGPLDVLGGWVLGVLSVFTEPLPKKLLALHSRYLISSKHEDIMSKFNINKTTYDHLRGTFFDRCATDSPRLELTLESWLEWTQGFLSSQLATLVFSTKTGEIKRTWSLQDFTDFCVVFGTGSAEQKATAIVYAVYSAHFKNYRALRYEACYSLSVYEDVCEESFFKVLKKTKKNEAKINAASYAVHDVRKNGVSSGNYGFGEEMNKILVNGAGESINSIKNNYEKNAGTNGDGVKCEINNNDTDSDFEANMLLDALQTLIDDTLRCSFNRCDEINSTVDLSRRNVPKTHAEHFSAEHTSESESGHTSPTGNESNTIYRKKEKVEIQSPEKFKTESPTKNNLRSNQDANTTHTSINGQSKTKIEDFSTTVNRALQNAEKNGSAYVNDAEHSLSYTRIGGVLKGCIQLIIDDPTLSGLKDLTICACCLFGIKPTSSSKEKEYAMELILRRQSSAPQNKKNPYGPLGTNWCVIHKDWWDSWCKYVGGQGGAVRSQGSPTSSPRMSQHSQPGGVDNWPVLVRQGGIVQLCGGLSVGKQVRFKYLKQIFVPSIPTFYRVIFHPCIASTNLHSPFLTSTSPFLLSSFVIIYIMSSISKFFFCLFFLSFYYQIEVIAPCVFDAICMWYGGGPRIERKVYPIQVFHSFTTMLIWLCIVIVIFSILII